MKAAFSALGCLALTLSALMAAASPAQATVAIPMDHVDPEGTYTIVEKDQDGELLRVLYHRKSETGGMYTLAELRCADKEYRELGQTFADDPAKMNTDRPSIWLPMQQGTRSGEVALFVCGQ